MTSYLFIYQNIMDLIAHDQFNAEYAMKSIKQNLGDKKIKIKIGRRKQEIKQIISQRLSLLLLPIQGTILFLFKSKLQKRKQPILPNLLSKLNYNFNNKIFQYYHSIIYCIFYLLLIQIFMLASVKKKGISFKNKIVATVLRLKAKVKRYRKRIIITLSILLSLFLIAGLVTGSFRGVDLTSQASIINYTQQKIYNGSYTNQVTFLGLGSDYFKVPKRKFIIYFEQQPSFSNEYWHPKLNARSKQGTRLLVSARFSCQVKSTIVLKDFLQDYGLGWRQYVKQKTRNVLVQKIADIKFYELNNSLILANVNSEFVLYSKIQNYPFNFRLISLKVQYPKDSFSSTNTLGMNLLSQRSLYSQLNSNYNILSKKMKEEATSTNSIESISSRIGIMQAQIKMIEMNVQSLDPNWLLGINNLKSIFQGNSTEIRRYLWVYFQKVYNGTYNNFTLF